MTGTVWVLLVALAGILYLFWRRVRGKSLDDLLALDIRLHHQVHHVIKEHPLGGTWSEYRDWMRAAE